MTALRSTTRSPENRITVLLVDDHKFLRKELRKILDAASDIQVVGEAADGKQAVDMALKPRPAVIVMDIAMPKLNGLEATLIRKCFSDSMGTRPVRTGMTKHFSSSG